ncbi:OmpA family protein [Elioraea rosea]|uniref:OmpA family protein n=1 Tax=Elioraea rosea TaxID=2492390 RepID=UPI001184313D|nr:OmpA family protein [Elioraea rosea]
MFRSRDIMPILAAAFLVSGLAACTETTQQASAPRHDAATSGPELAGVWYQVYFDTGSAEVNERGRMIARNVAYVTTNSAATRVTVIGRTDRIGAAPSNMALSERRATAVRDALISAGVPAARIDTSWTGEVRQAASQADTDPAHSRVVDVTVVRTP